MGIFHSIVLLIIFITFAYKSGPGPENFYPYEDEMEEEIDPRYEEVQFEEASFEEVEGEESDDEEDYSEEQVSEI